MKPTLKTPTLPTSTTICSAGAFNHKSFFLGKRLEHHRQLVDYPGSVVQDRTVYEDAEIFARNLYTQGAMNQRDWDTYSRLYKAISAFLPPPNLIIYLKADVETLMRHISQRGRDYERSIQPDYVARLNHLYDAWIEDWTLCPVLTIPMDGFDFQHNADHYEQIVQHVRARVPQVKA